MWSSPPHIGQPWNVACIYSTVSLTKYPSHFQTGNKKGYRLSYLNTRLIVHKEQHTPGSGLQSRRFWHTRRRHGRHCRYIWPVSLHRSRINLAMRCLKQIKDIMLSNIMFHQAIYKVDLILKKGNSDIDIYLSSFAHASFICKYQMPHHAKNTWEQVIVTRQYFASVRSQRKLNRKWKTGNRYSRCSSLSFWKVRNLIMVVFSFNHRHTAIITLVMYGTLVPINWPELNKTACQRPPTKSNIHIS